MDTEPHVSTVIATGDFDLVEDRADYLLWFPLSERHEKATMAYWWASDIAGFYSVQGEDKEDDACHIVIRGASQVLITTDSPAQVASKLLDPAAYSVQPPMSTPELP